VPLTSASVRRLVAAAALPLGLLVVAGCTSPGGGASPRSGPAVPVDTISAEIEEELGRRDDVSKVDVYYQDSVTVPESAGVDVTMQPFADPQAIQEEAVRLVWKSRLNPLSTIRVSVIDPVEPVNGVSVSLNLLKDAEREPLEERYGPRPD
jgi:hypothetical protein